MNRTLALKKWRLICQAIFRMRQRHPQEGLHREHFRDRQSLPLQPVRGMILTQIILFLQ